MKNDNFDWDLLLSENQQDVEKVYYGLRSQLCNWIGVIAQLDESQRLIYFQDALSITFENAISGKINFKSTTLKTYLFSVAKNLVFSDLRKNGKTIPLDFDLTGIEMDLGFLETTNKIKIMEEALNKLGTPCSQILTDYYFLKKSMKEIALNYGFQHEGSARNKKHKCLMALKTIFFKTFINDEPA